MDTKEKKITDIKADKQQDKIVLHLNPKIYCLDVIYSAAYSLLDKAHFLLDGDPQKDISVEIKPKKGQNTDNLIEFFKEELINYSVYRTQTEKNRNIRQTIIQRALLTNGFEEEEIEDPEEIAIPWEEKYGQDN